MSICEYEILTELGRGTTGVVYKARHNHVRPDRLVALKVPLLGSESDAPLRLRRHRNEAQVLALLTFQSDPVLPTLYDVGHDEKQFYFAREFVDGETLE